nr:hypothetical protein [Candidatus Sigynarchaeota archaeon]
MSSVLIGMAGILLGIALEPLVDIEGVRGEIASWSLIIFGFIYGTWGLYHGLKNKPHTHVHPHLHDHVHEEGVIHEHVQNKNDNGDYNDDHDHVHEDVHEHVHEHAHEHIHGGDHVHAHHLQPYPASRSRKELTIWSLFIIFVLGPCEPLIPLVMFEAITFDWVGLVWVTFLFCIATIAVMMAFVLLASKSLMKLRVKFLEQYIHAIAGYLIAGSGLAIILFGI